MLQIPKKIMTFFAHPDDETLAAGATLKKFSDRGSEIFVAIPNTGINSRKHLNESDRQKLLQQLREDTEDALRGLGVKKENILLGDFSDNEIDKHTLLELIHWIEPYIEQVKPDLILTHHRYCTNIDHQYCHEAIVVATRPGLNSHIPVLCGEVPSSTGYLKPVQWEPNLFIDISEAELDSKIRAMLTYKGEARPDPHPRSPEVLRALAKVRGSESGFFFAEAFMINKTFMV
jgi:LmbE family N-acetylglucosaminyl deacetylase